MTPSLESLRAEAGEIAAAAGELQREAGHAGEGSDRGHREIQGEANETFEIASSVASGFEEGYRAVHGTLDHVEGMTTRVETV